MPAMLEAQIEARPVEPFAFEPVPPLSALKPHEKISAPWASLLARFYKNAGFELPPMTRLRPGQLPSPFKELLAHNNDMTPTLERFYAERLSLRVSSREHCGTAYLREVVLALSQRQVPVEYGAIRIRLDRFPERVRRMIVREEHPFGRILEMEGIAHLGWPQAFLSVAPDSRMRSLLGIPTAVVLYGRRNVLLDGQRRMLAEVIEILAPVPASPAIDHRAAQSVLPCFQT